jgi:hypothetical protein
MDHVYNNVLSLSTELNSQTNAVLFTTINFSYDVECYKDQYIINLGDLFQSRGYWEIYFNRECEERFQCFATKQNTKIT